MTRSGDATEESCLGRRRDGEREIDADLLHGRDELRLDHAVEDRQEDRLLRKAESRQRDALLRRILLEIAGEERSAETALHALHLFEEARHEKCLPLLRPFG